jgi:hypothetical protein
MIRMGTAIHRHFPRDSNLLIYKTEKGTDLAKDFFQVASANFRTRVRA